MPPWTLVMLLLAGCASTPTPCASSLGCGGNRVCALDGRCAERSELLDGRSIWLLPVRWAATGSPRARTDTDRAVLSASDRSTLWLAFDAVPADALRAVLVLSPYDPDAWRSADGVVVVSRIRDGREIARARVMPGPGRPIRLDLGEEAASGAAIEIGVRLRGEAGVLALATPLHAERNARPRIEIVVPVQEPLPSDRP